MPRIKTSEKETELRKKVAQKLIVSYNNYSNELVNQRQYYSWEQLYRDCANKLPSYDCDWVRERIRSIKRSEANLTSKINRMLSDALLEVIGFSPSLYYLDQKYKTEPESGNSMPFLLEIQNHKIRLLKQLVELENQGTINIGSDDEAEFLDFIRLAYKLEHKYSIFLGGFTNDDSKGNTWK